MRIKLFFCPISLAAACIAVLSCTEEPRNTEPLTDPWTRERTPVNLRLESQIGAAVISNDAKDDAVGSVTVNLMTSALDLSKVLVEAIDFKFPQSEFCPKASIAPGSTIDLSGGSADFTVTAYNGETRVYTITYTAFNDALEGTWTFTKVPGILDPANAPQCACIIVGGWDGEVVRSTVMDKYWHWGSGYMPTDEDDNVLSFRLEKADPGSGDTFGTLVNTPGANGVYANYVYNNSIDVNASYRILPEGKCRWSKSKGGTAFAVYAFEDTGYSSPLYTVDVLDGGEKSLSGSSTFTVPEKAFARSFEGPFNIVDYNYPDTRWYTDNVRHVLWLVKKVSDSPLENHSALLQ